MDLCTKGRRAIAIGRGSDHKTSKIRQKVFLLYRGVNKTRKNQVWRSGVKE